MKKELDQIKPIETSEDTLTAMNNNPHMEGSLEIERGEYVTVQSLLKEYHRLKDKLKKKDDYIEELEAELIGIADSLYHTIVKCLRLSIMMYMFKLQCIASNKNV